MLFSAKVLYARLNRISPMPLFAKLFGDENDRFLKRAFKVVGEINALEPEFQKLSDQELGIKTREFKERLSKG